MVEERLKQLVNYSDSYHMKDAMAANLYAELERDGRWIKFENEEEATSLFLRRIARAYNPMSKGYRYAFYPTAQGSLDLEDGTATLISWNNGSVVIKEDDTYVTYIHLMDVRKWKLK